VSSSAHDDQAMAFQKGSSRKDERSTKAPPSTERLLPIFSADIMPDKETEGINTFFHVDALGM
jgi:hypothetical protein